VARADVLAFTGRRGPHALPHPRSGAGLGDLAASLLGDAVRTAPGALVVGAAVVFVRRSPWPRPGCAPPPPPGAPSASRRGMRRLRLALAALTVVLAAPSAPAAAQAGATSAPASAPASAPMRAPASALVVPVGTVRDGNLVVLTGDVDVEGQVRGDVVSVFGDVRVSPGGRVTGVARSVFGTARVDGGRVDGAVRSGWRSQARAPRPASPVNAAGVTLAWFAVLFILGFGLLAGASPQLDAVAGALEDSPGRAVATGLAGQLALAPGLVLAVVALAATVIGVLAIPLVVVAYVLAAAGLLILGFLAAAFVLGRWMAGGRAATGRPRAAAARSASLRALAVGLVLFFALWMAAALLGAVPVAGLFARAAALAVTWLAVTAGFGAALLSRGRRRAVRPGRAADAGSDARGGGVPVWQTPTPIAGVVAARRPLAATPTAGVGRE
jgi:hypothetical protein